MHDKVESPQSKPRASVDLTRIMGRIKTVKYFVLPDTTTTVCQAEIVNGFTILGTSACVDPAKFNVALGEKYAFEKVIDKMWELEGYLLAEEMTTEKVDLRLPKEVIANILSTSAADMQPSPSKEALRIAKVCHEVNRAYCQALGDHSQKPWLIAPQWQKDSAVAGVMLHMNANATPEASHVAWSKQKVADGWVYGETKDEVKKTHPCLVPFSKLPKEQQAKDFIFRAVVHALRSTAPVGEA